MLHLLKAWYGTKQADRLFSKKLVESISAGGFLPSKLDPCLAFCHDEKNKLEAVSLFHGDDIKSFGTARTSKKLNVTLRKNFEITGGGKISAHLGVKMEFNASGYVFYSAKGYIEDLLKIFNIEKCNGAPTPTIARRLEKREFE